MIRETLQEASRDVALPVSASVITVLGFTLPDWLMILTIGYAAVRLLAMIPKLFGCAVCFYKHRGCPLTCKSPSVIEK